MISALLIIAGLSCFLLGAIIIVQDYKKLTNRIFLSICLCFVVWSVSILSFLSTDSHSTALISSKIFYIIAGIFPCLLFLFASIFPTGNISSLTKVLVGLVGTAVTLSILFIPDFIVKEVAIGTESGNLVVVEPISYIIYAVYFVSIFAAGIYVAFRKFIEGRGDLRMQSGLYAFGILLNSIPGSITNLFLPYFGVYEYIWVGPVTSAFFVGFATYAIVRHGLFDIRLAAVRSLAYGLSIIVLASIYYFLAFIVSMTFFRGEVTSAFSVSPLNIGLALVLAFAFQPIKGFFDRITDKIFFRDRYNSTDFYKRLSSLLGSTTDLRGLLQRAAQEIGDTLKAEQTLFYVWQDEHKVSAGTVKHAKIPEEDIRLLQTTSPVGLVDEVIVRALLPEGDKVRRMLTSHHIAVALPLRQSSQTIGYLLLGEHQAASYTTRDVKVLASIGDELTIAIRNALSVQAVRDLNATLEQRIEKATEELRRTNARLRRLDQAKDEFLSMASHQLRTPLTSVKGYISMMLDGDTGKTTAMQKKVLSEAFSSSERMVHLIHDFLNVSRLQTGRFMLELNEVDLRQLVKEEVTSLQRVAEARRMKLHFDDQTKDLPMLMLDDTKMRQVVMNYIDNAIYYSQPETTINVELATTKKDVTLKVIDTGIGVPKSEQARLFEKFYRASNARKQRPDGTGVGIFLAKRVVEAQGGEIVFSSKEGKGSTFGFRLPLEQDEKVLLKNSAQELKK